MDGSKIEEIKALVRGLIAAQTLGVLKPLDAENAALGAANFLSHCRVHRALVGVEQVSDRDGISRPVPLVKVELRGANKTGYAPGRRTVFWGPDLPTQILRSCHFPDSIIEGCAKGLTPLLQPRLAELLGEMEVHVRALEADPAARERVSEKVRAIYEADRTKAKDGLLQTFKTLVKIGWSEEDVVRAWREASCGDVLNS